MKAVRIESGAPVLVDRPAPSGDDVVVKVAAVGICGSDLHLIDHGLAEGWVLGHEIAGHLPDGTAVAVEPFRTCGTCDPCTAGDRHRCHVGYEVIGIGLDGGMAEYVGVPEPAVVPLPAGLDVTGASLVENVAVAVHGVNRAHLTGGERVGVVGAGSIGLAVTAVLADAGFRADIGARHDHQRDAAARLGAQAALDDGYDVVVDAVGSSGSLAESIRRCRTGGRVVVVGTFWDPVQLDATILMKEVALVPAMMYGQAAGEREITRAARLLAGTPELGDALITHRYPLDGAAEAFAAARDRSGGSIKVVLEPSA